MVPPGLSRPAAAAASSAARPSASRPPSRYVQPDPGVPITNGGFATTRSKLRPATGASRSPCRSSSSTPFTTAFSAAKATARSLRSVAVTLSACSARPSAWTPQPVPRSRALPTGARSVASMRSFEAPPIPSTCSRIRPPVVFGSWSEKSSRLPSNWAPQPAATSPSPERRPQSRGSKSPQSSASSNVKGAKAADAASASTGTPATNSRVHTPSRSSPHCARRAR